MPTTAGQPAHHEVDRPARPALGRGSSSRRPLLVSTTTGAVAVRHDLARRHRQLGATADRRLHAQRATWEYGDSVEPQETSVTDSLGRSSCALFTGTAWHYARYRPGYPKAFFADLVARFHL